MDTSKAAAALGKLGGEAGRGESKRRGDSAHYRALVAGRKDRARYVATYAEREGMSAAEGDAVREACDDGARTLAEIRKTCRALNTSAKLSDDAGFARGRVEADGSYQLN